MTGKYSIPLNLFNLPATELNNSLNQKREEGFEVRGKKAIETGIDRFFAERVFATPFGLTVIIMDEMPKNEIYLFAPGKPPSVLRITGLPESAEE